MPTHCCAYQDKEARLLQTGGSGAAALGATGGAFSTGSGGGNFSPSATQQGFNNTQGSATSAVRLSCCSSCLYTLLSVHPAGAHLQQCFRHDASACLRLQHVPGMLTCACPVDCYTHVHVKD